VGTAIFRSTPMVFAGAGTPSRALALWVIGGALAWLGAWNRRTAAPLAATGVRAGIAVLFIALVGTTTGGRAMFDAMLPRAGLAALQWEDLLGGFDMLVAGSAQVSEYWGLALLTGVDVFALRAMNRSAEQPCRIPWFPWPALALLATYTYMLWASLEYARWLALIGVVPLAIGGVLGLFALCTSTLRQ
jgi:hypothetical protein